MIVDNITPTYARDILNHNGRDWTRLVISPVMVKRPILMAIALPCFPNRPVELSFGHITDTAGRFLVCPGLTDTPLKSNDEPHQHVNNVASAFRLPKAWW
jgi:hypothetical protein